MSKPTKDRILDEWTTDEINKLRDDLRAANEQTRADSERFAKEREDLRAQIEDRRSRYRELAREAGYTGDTAEHRDVMAWAKDQKALVASLRAEVATYEALSSNIDKLRRQELDKVVAAERARLVVPYRPGLLSVEQVRRHEAKDGWWQVRKDGEGPPRMDRAAIQEGRVMTYMDQRKEDTRRPCSADGTPLPWAEE